MNRILLRDESIELKNSRKIVDTRNRIIHGYDTVLSVGMCLITIPQIMSSEIEKLLNE